MKAFRRMLPMLLFLAAFYGYFSFSGQTEDNPALGVVNTILGILVLVLYIFNLAFPFVMAHRGMRGRELLLISLIAKIVLIPMFVLVFVLGIGMLVIPGIFLMAPLLVVFDYLMLLVSSVYGIAGLWRAWREGTISALCFGVNLALHLLFCLDVCSAIYSMIKVCLVERRQKKMAQGAA